MPTAEALLNLKSAIIEGEKEKAIQATKDALESGLDPQTILNEGLAEGTKEVGKLYEQMEYYLPDLVLAADAMVAAIGILKPHFEKAADDTSRGKILIGTVQGDVHTIGKDLMIALLQGQGYEVFDLESDVPPEKFVEEAKKLMPDLIGLSGLLTSSITKMKETVVLLKEEEIPAKIIVGGGILSKETCEMVGADEFTTDGWDGLKKIKRFMEARNSGGV